MTAARHDRIVQAVVQACLQAPALADGRVADESTYSELPETAATAIRVTLLTAQPRNVAYGSVDWAATVRVACMARVDDQDPITGRPTSTMAAQVLERLMADTTLGGLAVSIRPPALTPDVNYLSTRGGVLNADFEVTYRTDTRSLT